MRNYTAEMIEQVLKAHYEHKLVVKEIHMPPPMKKDIDTWMKEEKWLPNGASNYGKSVLTNEHKEIKLFESGQFLVVSEPE